MTESDSYLVSFRTEAARHAEKQLPEGNIPEAAHARSLQALSHFLEAGGVYAQEPTQHPTRGNAAQTIRYGIGVSIGAISLYVRAGMRTHAEYLVGFVDPMLDRIEATEDRPAVLGLSHEWRGDIATILTPRDARQHYERAREYYEPLDYMSDYSGWGSEPEFTVGFNRYVEHIEAAGYEELYESAPKPLQVQFIKRIEFKLTVLDRMLSDD